MYAVRNHGHDLFFRYMYEKLITRSNYVGFDNQVSVSYF